MTTFSHSLPDSKAPKLSWWRRFLLEPIRAQLLQGATPERLAWAGAVGVTIGIIPLMGTVSLFSITTAAVLRLNQPVTHLFNRLVLPLHLALIIPFIQLGQWLHRAPILSATVPELLQRFWKDPGQFALDFGLAAWHGFVAWLIVAPFLLLGVKTLLTPMLRKLSFAASTAKEVNA